MSGSRMLPMSRGSMMGERLSVNAEIYYYSNPFT